MAHLLLRLGATSSQADPRGCTAFYQYIDNGDRELVDVLLDQDKNGVKNSINHLLFSGYVWNMEVMSPLKAAVSKDDSILVLKLLNAGALTSVDFDTWLKSAKASPKSFTNLGDLERARQSYKNSYESPLFAAIQSGNAETAKLLLDNGADYNSLTARTNECFTNKWRWNYTEGRSVLDAVLDTLSKLQKFQGDEGRLVKPTPPKATDECLAKFSEGSYTHWVVTEDIKSKLKTYDDSEKSYLKDLERTRNRTGTREKNEAIQELIASFIALQKALVAKGAKVFSELHPEIDCKKPNYRAERIAVNDKETKPYNFEFKFTEDREMTDTRQEGYVNL